LDVLQNENLNILSICGGMGECETCVVEIQNLSESFSNQDVTNSFSQILACQTNVDRDLLVKIPDWRTLF